MKSGATQRFWQLYHSLPIEVRHAAVKAFRAWRENPEHPSLRFKKLQGRDDLYSVRVGKHHRAIGHLDGGAITWVWIGSHADYDRLVS